MNSTSTSPECSSQPDPSSSDNIHIPFSKVIGSEAKSVVLMPIVLVNEGQAPIKTIPFDIKLIIVFDL